MSVDWGFITQNEGGQILVGYTLNPQQFPNAGLTIATGVDIGQMSQAQVAALPIDAAAQAMLTPFAGLVGQAAVNALQAYEAAHGETPPTLTQADANALDNVTQQATYNAIVNEYDAASGGDFADLPSGAQTAIIDVAYQYGTNLAARTPNFWSDVTSGNWAAAINELNNFGDNFAPRRQAEAALVQGGDVNNGELNQGDVGSPEPEPCPRARAGAVPRA